MNKLFGASALVLGLAVSQTAFAYGSETEAEGDGINSAASKGGTAVSTNVSDNKLLSDNNTTVDRSKTYTKDESTHTDVDVQDNKLFSDNTTTATKTTTVNKDESKHINVTKDESTHTDVEVKDNKLLSDNNTTVTKDSYNDESKHINVTKDESKHVNVTKDESKHINKDESTHVSVGDISLAFETNKVVSKNVLANASIGNVANQEVKFGKGIFNAEAKMGEGANSDWAGMSQVNMTAGMNNSSQMQQSVTASVSRMILN